MRQTEAFGSYEDVLKPGKHLPYAPHEAFQTAISLPGLHVGVQVHKDPSDKLQKGHEEASLCDRAQVIPAPTNFVSTDRFFAVVRLSKCCDMITPRPAVLWTKGL